MNVLDDETLQVRSVMLDATEAPDLRSNVVVTAFVTSYANLELLQGMEFMGPEQLIYVGTHRVIAMEGPTYFTRPIGDCLKHFKSLTGAEKIEFFVAEGRKCTLARVRRS